MQHSSARREFERRGARRRGRGACTHGWGRDGSPAPRPLWPCPRRLAEAAEERPRQEPSRDSRGLISMPLRSVKPCSAGSCVCAQVLVRQEETGVWWWSCTARRGGAGGGASGEEGREEGAASEPRHVSSRCAAHRQRRVDYAEEEEEEEEEERGRTGGGGWPRLLRPRSDAVPAAARRAARRRCRLGARAVPTSTTPLAEGPPPLGDDWLQVEGADGSAAESLLNEWIEGVSRARRRHAGERAAAKVQGSPRRAARALSDIEEAAAAAPAQPEAQPRRRRRRRRRRSRWSRRRSGESVPPC